MSMRPCLSMMTSFFGNTGQRCLAASNAVIVGDDDNFYKIFVDKVVDRASKIKVGYGLDESVQMGPIRDKEKKANVLRYIESGIKEGAKLRLDGRKPNIIGGYPDTCFIGPTIFEKVSPKMKIACEEIFGPVMSIMRAKDLSEAIAAAMTILTATDIPSLPTTANWPGNSSTISPAATSALMWVLRRQWLSSPSADRRTPSSACCILRVRKPSASSLKAKWLFKDGFKFGLEGEVDKMILQTASEGISLAKKLESDSAQFYEEYGPKISAGSGKFLRAMAKENKKYVSQIETAYFGVITDAIEGCFAFHLDPENYAVNVDTPGISSYKNALTQAVKIEESIVRFYTDAAEQSKSLMADVPRTFNLIARKRGERLSKLKSLISGS